MIDFGRDCANFSQIRLSILAFAAIFTLSIAGCAPNPRFIGEIRPLPSSQIVVVRAEGHIMPNGIVIDGDVRRPNGYAGVVSGYLEIEGRDAVGTVIVKTKAKWGEFMSRRFRLAYFRAMLAASEPASIKTITVRAVTDPIQ